MKRATAPVRPSMRRAAFDASADFVAVKNLRISGVPVAVGEGIDKTALTPRRLEQMFDAREIGYAFGHVEVVPVPRVAAVGPTDLFNPGTCGGKPEADPEPKSKVRRVRSRRAA